jgi:hypothetical protein
MEEIPSWGELARMRRTETVEASSRFIVEGALASSGRLVGPIGDGTAITPIGFLYFFLLYWELLAIGMD